MKSRLMTLALVLFSAFSFASNPPTINPTPQSVTVGEGSINKPQKVRVVASNNADKYAVTLLESLFDVSNNKKDFTVFIGKKGDKEIRKYAKQIPNHPEGYWLSVENDKIIIAGNDDRGAYYGVQTLKQLLDSDKLSLIQITDYPNITARGVVEGFYGEPWSFENRMSQIRFYGENKLNTYIYGPKDDPYHRSPYWRDAYPTAEAEEIKKYVEASKENHVDFVWAIHPGMDIKWTTEDRDAMMYKLGLMYDLGVRAFAVFFDDISGEQVNAEKQAELLNYVDDNFVKVKKDVLPLILCPTEYNKSWSNIEKGYLPTLGEKLNPTIQIMWTGDRVISDIDVQGLEWINGHIKRNAYVWWNFPVSDYVRDHMLLGPSYGLDNEANGMMSGFMSNPMEHAESSKIAIYGVADYSWNIAKYDPMNAWERALKVIMPNNYDALRIFAIHNSDLGPNGHGYRRDESWEFKETAKSYLDGIKNQNLSDETLMSVRKEFAEMLFASKALMNSEDNKTMIEEINPWLKQYRLISEVGMATTYLQDALKEDNQSKFNSLYNHIKNLKQEMFDNSNTYNQNPYQPGVKTATLIIEPLIDSTLTAMANQYEMKYNEKLLSLSDYNPHSIYSNINQVKDQPVRFFRKNISISPMLEVVKIPSGGYFGIEMTPEQNVISAKINIGTEELPQWVKIETSVDGESWTTYQGKVNNRGDWTAGKTDEGVRYIRLINTSEDEQESYLKAFEVKVD